MSSNEKNSTANQDMASAIAAFLVERANQEEQKNIKEWLRSLMMIADSAESTLDKARRAIEETAKREVVWPIVKLLAGEVKRLAWDDRSLAARVAGGAAMTALALGGGEAGAGIAALGTAVGVPLWIVFAAGGAFAGAILEEIQRLLATDVADESMKTSSDEKSAHRADKSNEMSAEDAYKILGLVLGTGEDEVRRVHHRLLKVVHPDVGGSSYLAAQLNQARDRAIEYIHSGR